MDHDHRPAEKVDYLPESLDDWYLVTKDLARVWLSVLNDRESRRLEDLIARTKMPYVNWSELLPPPSFNPCLLELIKNKK